MLGRGPHLVVIFCLLAVTSSFADEPARVAAARTHKVDGIREKFRTLDVEYPPKAVAIRVFKDEDTLEVWVGDDDALALFKTYPVCARSGTLGPKRQQGDGQVPEGLYVVDRVNPWSNFHLSLGIDYPNAADRVAARKLHKHSLGGDIFIHGDCVTIGCIPLGDDAIEEVFLIVHDAKGERARVEVHIFPTRLSDGAHRERLLATLPLNDDARQLWENLTAFDERFNARPALLRWRVDDHGRYTFPRTRK